MRVIAQTVVPANPSFMHIAYIAAVEAQGGFGSLAGILIAGAVLLYLIQRKSWIWKAGVLVAIATVAVVSFLALPPARYAHPDMLTSVWARGIHNGTRVLQGRHEPVPSSARQIMRRSGLALEDTQDAWGRDFRVASYREGGSTQYRVISAGRDGRFGTKDDVRYPRLTNTESAQHDVKEIYDQVRRAVASDRRVPKQAATQPHQWGIDYPEDDPWQTVYAIRNGPAGPRVVSAGPDMKLGTQDDIACPPARKR